MNTLLRWAAVMLACLMATEAARAQNESGLAFLRVGTNAAALGMGDAYMALSRGAFATYWNPAGLAGNAPNMAAVTHHIWVGDVRTYTVAARFQAGARGGLGLALTANTSGDLEARTEPGPVDGFFSLQYVSAGVSYGHAFGPFRAGVTGKYLSERIYGFTSSGYAFDAGVQAAFFAGDLALGLVAQHFGRMSELERQATPLPRTLRAGVAVRPFHIRTTDDDTPLVSTTFSVEMAHQLTDERAQTRLHAGAAAELFELVTLRTGVIAAFRDGALEGDDLRPFSLGLGFGLDALRFDYAYLPFRSGFGRPGHVLTLEYVW